MKCQRTEIKNGCRKQCDMNHAKLVIYLLPHFYYIILFVQWCNNSRLGPGAASKKKNGKLFFRTLVRWYHLHYYSTPLSP